MKGGARYALAGERTPLMMREDGVSDQAAESVEANEWEAEGKVAHPIELFFDLVYVFAFTRVVGLIVHDHNLESALQGALLLGLLWWSWGTWTWTMNAVDLRNRFRRVMILAAMLGIFLMGYAVPTAFTGDGKWLAAGYVFARLLSGAVMWFGTIDDEVEHASIRQFLPVSMIAPTLVIIGAVVGGTALQWIWLAALVVEVGSALLAGQNEWHVDAGHFAERHGLIMIIALGEAIIAVGVALTAAAGEDASISIELAWRLGVGLVGVCAMWWAYFDKMQAIWEVRLDDANNSEAGRIARDVYSLGHFPMIVGVVFFAVALEEAFLHPTDPLTDFTRWMLASSLAMYLLAQSLCTYRCWNIVNIYRPIGVVLIVAFTFTTNMKAELAVLIVTVIMVLSMVAEYIRFREEVRSNPHLQR